jgi:hypothetical protein
VRYEVRKVRGFVRSPRHRWEPRSSLVTTSPCPFYSLQFLVNTSEASLERGDHEPPMESVHIDSAEATYCEWPRRVLRHAAESDNRPLDQILLEHFGVKVEPTAYEDRVFARLVAESTGVRESFVDQAMSRSSFVDSYLKPAVEDLAQRYLSGEPLSDLDHAVLQACGVRDDRS